MFAAARRVFSEQDAHQVGAAFERMKLGTAKGGDSMIASTIDLIANLLPPRWTNTFRKNVKTRPQPSHGASRPSHP